MIPCVYWGVFFDDADLPEGSLFREIENKHATFAFRTPMPEELLGRSCSVGIIGYGCDGNNEALLVDLPEDVADYRVSDVPAHITLSVSETGRPKDSGYMDFAETDDPYWIEGVFGYYSFDNEVITG